MDAFGESSAHFCAWEDTTILRQLVVPTEGAVTWDDRCRQNASEWPFYSGAEPSSPAPFKGHDSSPPFHFHGWDVGLPKAGCQKE